MKIFVFEMGNHKKFKGKEKRKIVAEFLWATNEMKSSCVSRDEQ